MFKNPIVNCAVLAILAGVSASTATASVTIPTVTIGYPGNLPEVSTSGQLFGSVPYTYRMGATEVTNAQYAAFLNAVAAADPNNLYSMNMASATGGIIRSGADGSYTYAAVSDRENNPVNYVSFWDATRFANWLHNGQPTGPQSNSTTEDGAYTLTPDGINSNSVTRNASAEWAVPTDNEWYKAAYYQPADQGGDGDNYWLYPTSSNSITTADANYGRVVGGVTPVRSYAPNFYGTFDMAGNVSEWTDGMYTPTSRPVRGDNWALTTAATARTLVLSLTGIQSATIGFRVVQIPDPPAPCLGDGNNDGTVSFDDVTAALTNFAATGPAPLLGDSNFDGEVTFDDVVTVLSNFSAVCP